MRIKKILMLQICMLCSLGLSAQEVTTSGTITDAADGQRIPFVTVQVKGTAISVASDVDGKYDINTAIGDTLIFSSLGYKAQEIRVEQSSIDVKMEEDISEFDTVVTIKWPRSHPTILVPATRAIMVSGTITVACGKASLVRVTVEVKGTYKAVMPSSNGNYSISTAIGDTLVFSYPGYKTQEIRVEQSIIDVKMEKEDIPELDKVIIG